MPGIIVPMHGLYTDSISYLSAEDDDIGSQNDNYHNEHTFTSVGYFGYQVGGSSWNATGWWVENNDTALGLYVDVTANYRGDDSYYDKGSLG